MSPTTEALSIGTGAVVPENFSHGVGCVVDAQSFVGEGCVFEDRVYVGVHATLSPPPSEGDVKASLLVRDGASIGPGAVVCGATVIGQGARVEPGAVVTDDIPPFSILAGNPARVIGYVAPPVGAPVQRVERAPIPDDAGVVQLVGGAELVRLPEKVDLRGRLTYGEVGGLLPFVVKRFFFVYGVPSQEIRGEHAHHRLRQMLIAASGNVSVVIDDGHMRQEVLLDRPSMGLHIPPLVWGIQFRHSSDAVLLVLASDEYSADDYIRDYDEFLRLVK
jgi:UDP-2-acetamido-3-amino-2,3-dideoxy-glucuronate N-acetyltransferase